MTGEKSVTGNNITDYNKTNSMRALFASRIVDVFEWLSKGVITSQECLLKSEQELLQEKDRLLNEYRKMSDD